MSDKQDQLVVVTGASSGIGLAMTQQLLAAGYRVLGVAKEFATQPDHENFSAREIDMADIDSLPAAVAALIAELKTPVRALVNNAGLGKMGYLEQLSVDDIRLVMNVNFLSHVIVTKTFLPLLKQQRALADIVFTGSEAALEGARQGSAYCASKFAIRGFAQALRDECGKSDIRVSLLNPGPVRTPFFDQLHFEPGAGAENAIEAADIARLLLLILDMRAGTVIDEINLSPMTHVWQRKS